MFKKYGDRSITFEVDEDGSAATVTSLKGVDKVADSLDGRNVEIKVDSDGSARKQTEGLTSGFKGLATGIRSVGTVLTAASIPFAIAGIGAGIPTIAALGSSVAGLAVNLGKAASGFALVGGAAYAGARGGLAAYTKLISSSVSASREAYSATHEHAIELLEQRRQTILNTKASSAFNAEINDQIIGFTKLQAEVGNRVFPMFTDEMDAWGEILDANRSKIASTAERVATMGVLFAKWFRTAEDGKILDRTLGFINSSAVKGAQTLMYAGRIGTMAFQPLIPLASKLQSNIVSLADRTEEWVWSTEGAKTIKRVINDLWRESERLGRTVKDLGTGFFRVFQSIDNAGLSDQASAGLGSIASGLERITREGTDSRRALDEFMQNTETLMPVVGGAVMAFVRQIGRLAGTLIKAREEGHRLTILQEIFEGIRKSAKPFANLIENTFKDLGPEIAKLIPNLAKIAETFAGSSGPLSNFVRILNRAANIFVNLPDPIKNTIANLVALKIILGGLGFGALVGGIRDATVSFMAFKSATGKGMWAGMSAGIMGVVKSIGILRLALISTGIGAALVALGAAGVVIYKNWDKVRGVFAPLGKMFKNLWADISPFARVLKESLVDAMKSFASGLLSVIVPGRSSGSKSTDCRRGSGSGLSPWARP